MTFMAFNFTGHRKQYIWNILEPGEENLKHFDFLPGWDGPIAGYTDISGARRTLLSPGAITVAAVDPYNSEVAIPPLNPFTGETVRDTFIEDITPKADRADTSVTFHCYCNGLPYHCIINSPEIHIWELAAGSGVPPLAGDTNRDGSRNIFDLLEMLQLITDPDPADYGRGDLDYNGKVDIFDLLEILRLLKG
ncbi:MAG: dockerin type I repeat-containing protein [Gemmatimonadota bacterium]|nr:dockerin type I repeat-containing protein [Gemmatimonadota bacterium]